MIINMIGLNRKLKHHLLNSQFNHQMKISPSLVEDLIELKRWFLKKICLSELQKLKIDSRILELNDIRIMVLHQELTNHKFLKDYIIQELEL